MLFFLKLVISQELYALGRTDSRLPYRPKPRHLKNEFLVDDETNVVRVATTRFRPSIPYRPKPRTYLDNEISLDNKFGVAKLGKRFNPSHTSQSHVI